MDGLAGLTTQKDAEEQYAERRGKLLAQKNMGDLLYKEESYLIRGVAFDIYKQFRNSHKEKIYRDSFFLGLLGKGLKPEKEKRLDIFYNNKKVGTYVPDLVVNDEIFIEAPTSCSLFRFYSLFSSP